MFVVNISYNSSKFSCRSDLAQHDNGKVKSESPFARKSRLNIGALDVNVELNVLSG